MFRLIFESFSMQIVLFKLFDNIHYNMNSNDEDWNCQKVNIRVIYNKNLFIRIHRN